MTPFESQLIFIGISTGISYFIGVSVGNWIKTQKTITQNSCTHEFRYNQFTPHRKCVKCGFYEYYDHLTRGIPN